MFGSLQEVLKLIVALGYKLKRLSRMSRHYVSHGDDAGSGSSASSAPSSTTAASLASSGGVAPKMSPGRMRGITRSNSFRDTSSQSIQEVENEDGSESDGETKSEADREGNGSTVDDDGGDGGGGDVSGSGGVAGAGVRSPLAGSGGAAGFRIPTPPRKSASSDAGLSARNGFGTMASADEDDETAAANYHPVPFDTSKVVMTPQIQDLVRESNSWFVFVFVCTCACML